ncbi:unnamed protein product [Merluccius merluccius]
MEEGRRLFSSGSEAERPEHGDGLDSLWWSQAGPGSRTAPGPGPRVLVPIGFRSSLIFSTESETLSSRFLFSPPVQLQDVEMSGLDAPRCRRPHGGISTLSEMELEWRNVF